MLNPEFNQAPTEATMKIKLEGERQRYTVQAHNERFFIMTKPFNARQTYLYTIADLQRGVRGPCNKIFGLPCDVNTPEGAKEALELLQSGDMEVSYRRCVDLAPSDVAALMAIQAGSNIPVDTTHPDAKRCRTP